MRVYQKIPPGFSNLFSPVEIGDLLIKNRVVLAPMDVGMINPDGSLTQRVVDYYEERARGGAGLIITQFTSVVDDQRMDSPGVFSGRQIFGLNYLAETVQEYGARIFLQIAHHGGRALRAITGLRPVAPSAVLSPLYQDIPRELSQEEIEDLIEKFIQAAKRAKIAGFDGVEVHGAHSYLIGQFISPHTNRRIDKYGKDFRGRMRFPAEIVKGIKEECGKDFPVGFKFSAYEHLEGGVKIKLTKKIARYMEKVGVDYLHVASSTYELRSWKYLDVSPVYAPPGEVIELAGIVKSEVSVPVIGGGGVNDPLFAEEVLEQGKVDLIALGRALLADPTWPVKVERGKIEEILPCIRCNRCHKRLFSGREVRCTVNPRLGRERKYQIRKVDRTKKIVVVGGGPAGLEAALTLNKRGHKVILYEKRNRLGGNMVSSSLPSFKKDVKRLLSYYLRNIEKSSVEVRLEEKANVSTIVEENPEVVILATGAKQVIPRISGLKRELFYTPSEVLDREGELELGERIIVLGAGLVGCEIAWYLALQGKKVKLFDVLGPGEILQDEHSTNRFYLLHNLKKQGISILASRKILKVEDKKAIFKKNEEGKRSYFFDSLIICVGFEPQDELLGEIRESEFKGEIYAVGDCVKPRDFYHAIQEGAKVGREIC
jgi:2,4-dienoyl-CoA reductase-like NADH-dependent reductase (Old Yellow Enzyme family)/thioredoxin reductase